MEQVFPDLLVNFPNLTRKTHGSHDKGIVEFSGGSGTFYLFLIAIERVVLTERKVGSELADASIGFSVCLTQLFPRPEPG
ncbi:MAG: hypothetical protein AUI84_06985 [Delftia sp. 13_1_40CM_3_66_6]|nr:MAG: hypothetical protein AUI84_06985 [Delftia sp. 13_1_40CM_3_66_6]